MQGGLEHVLHETISETAERGCKMVTSCKQKATASAQLYWNLCDLPARMRFLDLAKNLHCSSVALISPSAIGETPVTHLGAFRKILPPYRLTVPLVYRKMVISVAICETSIGQLW
jgi:hypothetical protein